jgi:Polyketide synthase dehydratase
VKELKIRIDPRTDTFLLDHVVAGVPLLPTVMQLDLAARALPACGVGPEAPGGIVLRDIVVGAPVCFDRSGPRELHLVSRWCGPRQPEPGAVRCELRTRGEPAVHLTAVAERLLRPVRPARSPEARSQASRSPASRTGPLPCGPDLVYPPFFHGATFAVVGTFGRSAAGMAAQLAVGLPPLRWAAARTVLRPRLLELLLQCCGLWELADSGRMMIPAAIERVHWHPDSLAAGPEGPAVACVASRPGLSDGGRVFDGQVLGPDGSVLVTVAGYRTTDLGLVPDLGHATRLRRCLDAPRRPGLPAAGQAAAPPTAEAVAS